AGDCYDVIYVPGGDRLWIFVADATGHGIGPAIAVAQAHAMFCLGVRAGLSLESILSHMNARLQESLPIGRFVCAFLGELDMTSHELRYAAAGLSPIVRVRPLWRDGGHSPGARGVEVGSLQSEMDSTHPPLGLEESLHGSVLASVTLEAGDGLVVATDGIYERPNKQGRPTGAGAVLEQAVQACTFRSPGASVPGVEASELLRGIMEPAAVGAVVVGNVPGPRDDQTIVVLARNHS
ncbi:MAG: serine/threonine-protein phosphatase, partial [Pyrinomonadaceae bacterium]|nr:serine/threonine-protein phosphatase [Phycisphaerales bacterium]